MIYEVEGTYKTPYLFIDDSKGEFKLGGRCISEYPADFFKDFISKIVDYSNSPKENTILDISLEYANTSSIKVILDILKKIESVKNSNIIINWNFEEEDEDILELGKDFESIIDTKINFIEI